MVVPANSCAVLPSPQVQRPVLDRPPDPSRSMRLEEGRRSGHSLAGRTGRGAVLRVAGKPVVADVGCPVTTGRDRFHLDGSVAALLCCSDRLEAAP